MNASFVTYKACNTRHNVLHPDYDVVCSEEVSGLQGKVDELQRKLAAHHETILQLESSLQESQAAQKAARSQLKDADSELNTLRSKIQTLEFELQQAQDTKEQRKATSEGDDQSAKEQADLIVGLRAELESQKDNIEALETQLKDQTAGKGKADADLAKVTAELSALEEQLEILGKNNSAAEELASAKSEVQLSHGPHPDLHNELYDCIQMACSLECTQLQ